MCKNCISSVMFSLFHCCIEKAGLRFSKIASAFHLHTTKLRHLCPSRFSERAESGIALKIELQTDLMRFNS